MHPSHIKIILAILAALGIGTGTLLTGDGGDERAPSNISLDEGRINDLGKTVAREAAGSKSASSQPATAINCARDDHWTRVGGTRINQAHIFCGEWNDRRNRPKGFHSRPGGANPGTVGGLEISQRANADGIYGVRWRFAGRGGDDKFSTMFPDACSRAQVLASIAYADANRRQCPASAPDWAWCGASAPNSTASGYCTTDRGRAFTIAGASRNDGSVNTAFPLR